MLSTSLAIVDMPDLLTFKIQSHLRILGSGSDMIETAGGVRSTFWRIEADQGIHESVYHLGVKVGESTVKSLSHGEVVKVTVKRRD